MARTEEYAEEDSSVFSLDISVRGGKMSRRGSEAVPAIPTSEAASRIIAIIANQTNFENQLLEALKRNVPLFRGAGIMYCQTLAKNLREEGYIIREHGPGTANAYRKKGRQCLENLSHNFLTCVGDSITMLPEELVVEPRFRDEFQIAQPTENYAACLSVIPNEFVGTPTKLIRVVKEVSEALAQAFEAKSMALPPWRRASALLSKWGLDETSSTLREATAFKSEQKSIRQPELKGRTSHVEFIVQPKELARLNPCKEVPIGPVKAKVSLLARGLAEAAALKKMNLHQKRKSDTVGKNEKLKRTFSWDFSGLQPITTVRRAGQAR